MKKLLLGCGILLAIGLGTLGFIAYQLWPDWQEATERGEVFAERIMAIDAANPFDPEAQADLDTTRFASFLELRSDVRRALEELKADIGSLRQDVAAEELGAIEIVKLNLQQQPLVYDALLPLLEQHQMGLSEMGWHTQVLWAALENIDAGGGGGDTQLDALRGLFPRLEDSFDKLRAEDAPSAQDLLTAIDSSVVSSARKILATDVDRVKSGMMEPELEAFCFAFSSAGMKIKLGFLEVDVGTHEDGAEDR
jgi:hypothetical protein